MKRHRGALALAAALALPLGAVAETATGAPEDWPSPHPHRGQGRIAVEELEYRFADGDDALAWEGEASWSGSRQAVSLESEGEWETVGAQEGELEFQLVYSRLLTAFWDVGLGARQDVRFGPGHDGTRTLAVLQLEGLAPYGFELEPELFVDAQGHVLGRLEGRHELRLTRRSVLESKLELEASASDWQSWDLRRGLTRLELGLRLRFELRPWAPYLGVHWERALGGTGVLARRRGGDLDSVALALGLRAWF